MGVELNMQTWNLLDKKDRDERDDKRMIYFAKASLYHWRLSSNYQPVNEQRGQWLISHVFAVLNRGDEALAHAKTCMDITMNESLKDFDLAYASLGQVEKMNQCFINAKASGNKIIKDEDRKLFFFRPPW